MKTFLKTLRRQEGFTLVELMVVVAIIGLLSAVAIPNFRKYQAKSKTSEAKLQLSAVYTALQSWYSDYDNYSSCLNLMGYDPAVERDQRYYAVGAAAAVQPGAAVPNTSATTNGAPTACASAAQDITANTVTSSAVNATGYNAGKRMAGVAALASADLTVANANVAAVTATTFRMGALGIIDASKTTNATADSWTINENKRLVQFRTGY